MPPRCGRWMLCALQVWGTCAYAIHLLAEAPTLSHPGLPELAFCHAADVVPRPSGGWLVGLRGVSRSQEILPAAQAVLRILRGCGRSLEVTGSSPTPSTSCGFHEGS